jgi:hypothetical protein
LRQTLIGSRHFFSAVKESYLEHYKEIKERNLKKKVKEITDKKERLRE